MRGVVKSWDGRRLLLMEPLRMGRKASVALTARMWLPLVVCWWDYGFWGRGLLQLSWPRHGCHSSWVQTVLIKPLLLEPVGGG